MTGWGSGVSVKEAGPSVVSTRCRDISSSNEGDKMHATRAEWRVEEDAEAPPNDLVAFDIEVKPERAGAGVLVVWVGGVGVEETICVRAGRPPPTPWRALTTFCDRVASAFSKTLTRSFNSLFSLSISTVAAERFPVAASGDDDDDAAARSALFSRSSEVTRSRSSLNSALRRSRLTCAAILLRSARASLRSSEEAKSVRGRLREGCWEDDAGEGAETAGDGAA